MKSLCEPLRFPHPPKDVRLGCVLNASEAHQRELDEQVRHAYDRGRTETEKALREQLLQQRAEMQELFGGVLRSLQESIPGVIRDTERVMVTLALQIARKLVADLPITAAMVEQAVRDALVQAEGSSEFHIRLHPADLDLLQKTSSALLSSGHESGNLYFQASNDVTRGGCLVQTHFGLIDGRIESKVDALRQSLLA